MKKHSEGYYYIKNILENGTYKQKIEAFKALSLERKRRIDNGVWKEEYDIK